MFELLNKIAETKKALQSGAMEKLGSEETLACFGLKKAKEDAFVKIAAKIQTYVDLSLELRKKHPEFRGLPPTQLTEENSGQFVPQEETAAIDQQRQLYAAARSTLIDPAYADRIMGDLIDWHDAFVLQFVIDETNGPKIRAKVAFGSKARSDDPDPKANLRLTYALQGSATLVDALATAADRSVDAEQATRYRAKADSIKGLCLSIGDQFYRDYADIKHPGRYFLYPNGISEIDVLEGLSHNNSQSYLIEGMAALAELDGQLWAPRLRELLAFIQTQRDKACGLLHEFDINQKGSPFPYDAVGKMEGTISWQSQENHETVVLGHTLAGLYACPARLIADSSNPGRLPEMTALVEDFVKTMNLIHGVKEHGLPANAYQLIPDGDSPCIAMPWPAGAWQAELLWQFLLHADRAGVVLNQFEVETTSDTLTLDHLLARGFDYHDKNLFNGVYYVTQDGDPFRGRQYAAPINHAADTLRDLALNLR